MLGLAFGPASRQRLDEVHQRGLPGALAALESFYFAFDNRDLDALAAVWSDDPLAQLNNPVGGVVRGAGGIVDLYRRIFASPARVTVTFDDAAAYGTDEHAVFAGRETGSFVTGEAEVALSIRTTRYFVYSDGRWRQLHHHGSIDDPKLLATYQQAVAALSSNA